MLIPKPVPPACLTESVLASCIATLRRAHCRPNTSLIESQVSEPGLRSTKRSRVSARAGCRAPGRVGAVMITPRMRREGTATMSMPPGGPTVCDISYAANSLYEGVTAGVAKAITLALTLGSL